jgi:hypothetical protein
MRLYLSEEEEKAQPNKWYSLLSSVISSIYHTHLLTFCFIFGPRRLLLYHLLILTLWMDGNISVVVFALSLLTNFASIRAVLFVL